MKRRKQYPKDIGMRWCIPCGIQTYYRWSASRNTYVCEKCDYAEVMTGIGVLASEIDFIRKLDKGEIP